MCKPASFVVTKNKAFWSKSSDSHEAIIKEHNLVERVAGKYTFVRVEISPKDGDLSSNTRTWRYSLDQDVKPSWYDAVKVEKMVRAELKKWKKAKVVTRGTITVNDGAVYAYGSSTVEACGSSTVRAYDSSTVIAYDSSTVIACDSSTVEACGSSTVRAYDSSTVIACDSSTVEACDSSTVRAYDSSTVRAYDSSTVTACYGHATVRQYGKSEPPTPTSQYAVVIDCRGAKAICITT